MDTKVCSCPGCPYQGQSQPTSNFYKQKLGFMGLGSFCKKCKNRQARERYRNNPEVREAIASRGRKYRQTERGKEVRKKAFKNYIEKHPERIKAIMMVHSRVQNNKNWVPASQLLCTNCGKQAQEYHHHNGYDKDHQLDVIPLCAACHDLAHLK